MKNYSTLAEKLINEAYTNGGTSLSAYTHAPITEGYAVASQNLWEGKAPEQSDIAEINTILAEHKPSYVGSWLDSETNIYYIDAITIVDDIDYALHLAKARNEIAIYNLSTKEEIRL